MVSRRQVCLVGGIYGCGCWEVGLVVLKYIDFLILSLFPTPLVLYSSFFAAASLLCSFLKCFFVLVYVIFVHYSSCCSKNIRDHSKIKITRTWRYNYIDKNVC